MKKKLLYVHIPKCGGNTIKKINRDRIFIWGHNIRSIDYVKYPDSKAYKKRKYLPFVYRYLYDSFTIVRNPWSRVFSAYMFLNKGGINEKDKEDYSKYIKQFNSFEDFVTKGLREASANQLHFLPQTFWLLNANNKLSVSRVVKLEDINVELPSILKRIDITIDQITKENQSHSLNYIDMYTPEMVTIVEEIYKQEIELFNYTFTK